MEIWKDIEGYEGYYQVSDLGKVRSLNRVVAHIKNGPTKYKGRLLKPGLNNKGYKQVNLCRTRKSKMRTVHKLVAEAFLSNPENFPIVMHLDDNPLNNMPSNLKWGTQQDNMADMDAKGRRAKSKTERAIFCIETGEFFSGQKAAARKTGLHYRSINNCVNGRRSHAGKLVFKYVEE